MVLAHDSKGHELLIIELLSRLRGAAPCIGVDEENAIGKWVDDERLDGISMLIPDELEDQTEKLEAQAIACLDCQRQTPGLSLSIRARNAVPELRAEKHAEDGVTLVSLHRLAVSPTVGDAAEHQLDGAHKLLSTGRPLDELQSNGCETTKPPKVVIQVIWRSGHSISREKRSAVNSDQCIVNARNSTIKCNRGTGLNGGVEEVASGIPRQ